MYSLKLVSIVIGIFLFSSAAEAKECLLSGKWKSNEEKTLKNMSKAKLTKKQRKYLSNNFFGRLVVINTCKKSKSYFEGDSETETIKYISVKENGNIITTEYYSELFGETMQSVAVLDGNCYSLGLESMGFSEVFCRVK